MVTPLQSARIRFNMLLPKGGVTWKSAKARLPPWRAFIALVSKPRFVISIALAGLCLLLWRGISKSASEMQRYVFESDIHLLPLFSWNFYVSHVIARQVWGFDN